MNVYDAENRAFHQRMPARQTFMRIANPRTGDRQAVTSKPPSHAGHPSDDQNVNVAEPPSLWAELELDAPEFLDESLAPEVDEGLLRSLIRQELPEKVDRAVYQLICQFASWHRAHTKLLLEELHASRRAAD